VNFNVSINFNVINIYSASVGEIKDFYNGYTLLGYVLSLVGVSYRGMCGFRTVCV